MTALSATLGLLRARTLFLVGQREPAIELVDTLLRGKPDDPASLFCKARMLINSNAEPQARAVLERLACVAPDFPRGLKTLARLSFPGPPYREVLKLIHTTLRPKTYLEIGVEYGSTLQLASYSEVIVGVDPNPQIRRRLPRGTRLFSEPSDAFFEKRTRESLFGVHPVEFGFIDGMHLFEFVLRDFINVERWCTPRSTVVLHDCLPIAPISASRERMTSFWVGDTWKALECLLEYRPDLEISVVPTFPSGLVIIRGLDPESDVLSRAFAEIEARYKDRLYPHKPGRWPEDHPILANTEARLRELLTTGVASSRLAHVG